MVVFFAHLRLALLTLLLAAASCDATLPTPCRTCDASIGDGPLVQTQDVHLAEAAPALDASADAAEPWPPTSRDAPAGEAQTPTPIPDAGYLVVEDFAAGTTPAWEALAVRNGIRYDGTWDVVQGDSGSLFTQGFLDGTTWHIAYATMDIGRNQVVEATLRVADFYAQAPSYVAALFGRYDPLTDSGYFVALRGDGSVTLRRRDRGTNASWGGSVPGRFRPGVWYSVRLEIIGNAITAFLDGVEVSTVTDPSPLAGDHVGLGAFGAILEVDRVSAAGLD
jgi:hypothetical protein